MATLSSPFSFVLRMSLANRACPTINKLCKDGVAGKAEVGFEPTNNGFAIRPLSPLGYSANAWDNNERLRVDQVNDANRRTVRLFVLS
jgi:hypothetical protein